MLMSVEMEGGQRLLRTVDAIPKKMRSKIVRKAVDAGATIVLQAARGLIKKRTGFSGKALGKRGRTKKGEYTSKIGARSSFKTTYRGRPHEPVHVIHLIDQGAAPHQVTNKLGHSWQHPGAKPQHFLEPAMNSIRTQVSNTMGNKVMEGIKEAVV